MFEDSLCPDCHQPSWMAYDPRNTGEFSVDTSTQCEACAVLHTDSDEKSPPGQKTHLRNHITE